jgi:hypothetical protein
MRIETTSMSRSEVLDLRLKHDDWHIEEVGNRTYLVR